MGTESRFGPQQYWNIDGPRTAQTVLKPSWIDFDLNFIPSPHTLIPNRLTSIGRRPERLALLIRARQQPHSRGLSGGKRRSPNARTVNERRRSKIDGGPVHSCSSSPRIRQTPAIQQQAGHDPLVFWAYPAGSRRRPRHWGSIPPDWKMAVFRVTRFSAAAHCSGVVGIQAN